MIAAAHTSTTTSPTRASTVSGQAAEGEGGGHPRQVDARRERDQFPVHERERRAEHPEGRGSTEWIAPAREKREHGNGDRGDAEPQRRVGRVLGVAPENELERAGEGQQHDHDVEPVPACALSEPFHGLNVLDSRGHRLLPE